MKEYALIFLLVYGAITVGLIFIGYFRCVKKESTSVKNRINLNDIVVIIPFRNEIDRISGILDSIRNSTSLPKEIVFIDDHSTDNTSDVIYEKLAELNMRILPLSEGRMGKKEALRYGIEQTQSKYILTMDGDVEFEDLYFERISELEQADLYVLPAILKAHSWFQRLYEIDTILVNALNVAIAGWSRPIFASGANLLYSRERYYEVENYASHQHMASGDDTYLLRDFRDAQKNVRLVSGKMHGISTETPQSIRAFFDQRVRWAGKSGDVKDTLANALAILQFILSVGFITGLVIFSLEESWRLLVAFFFAKLCIDVIAYLPYFKRIGRSITLLFLPAYELIFPLYFLVMIVLIAFYSPKWKGRSLRN